MMGESVDREALEILRRQLGAEKDATAYCHLVGQYLEMTQKRLEMIERGIRENDIKTMRDASHGLRGTSCHFGAQGMSELARQIETALQAGRADRISGLLESAKAEFEQVRPILERESSNG